MVDFLTIEHSLQLAVGNVQILREIVSRVSLADVRAFGMTWEDYENFLSRWGYRVSVKVSEAAAMGECRW